MPGMVFFNKMVPHEIEASVVGLALSIIKFNSEVICRLTAAFINLFFDVTSQYPTPENPDEINGFINLWKMYLVQTLMLLIPFFFYNYIISRKDVESV